MISIKKGSLKDIGFYLLIIIILFGTVWVLLGQGQSTEPSYSKVLQYFEQKQVKTFTLEGNTLKLKLQDGKEIEYKVAYLELLYQDLHELVGQQRTDGVITDYDVDQEWQPPWWVMFIPYLLLIGIIVVLWYYMFNRAGGGGDKAMRFGKARTRLGSDEKKKVTFQDVAGAEEEKAELQEIIDFLKNPRKFIEIGARIPKGVLLVGPPGTGKTLIAKAVAGEAGVQFLSISGSDFVELYVGVGASRVRDLFEQAKKVAPSIIFIDEIDAVGRHRGAGMGGGHDEREQTLNQLLVEMDGFGNNEGVIIIAATNRPDILDPALLRPGRFDREVYIGKPDIKGREAILKVHSKGKPLDADVKLETIAKTTAGFTGADLENLLNEAALLSARRNKRVIGMSEIEEAMLKVVAGPEKKSKVVSEKERRLTAYHEAGHAIVMKNLETHDPVHQISIIPRGMAGGMTISLPKEDKEYMSKSEMLELITSFLGGRVAEKLILNDISTGASSDIQRATSIARKMITRYGMSDSLGPIAYGSDNDEVFLGRDFQQTRNYSEDVAAKIDSEIKAIIDAAYLECETILGENLAMLHGIANYLLENETMDSDTFECFFSTGDLPNGEKSKKYIDFDPSEKEKDREKKRQRQDLGDSAGQSFSDVLEGLNEEDQ